jgi:DNA-binding CsgD family transcriptional regulator
MQDLFLKPIHVEILNMLVTGVSRVKIAAKLSIKVSTVNSYLRDMNRENECNVYQLIWMYAQASKKYTIKNI